MQLDLIPKKEIKTFSKLTHGGESKKPKRKVKRPLIENKITHVVFKSSKAKGEFSFFKHKEMVKQILKQRSKKYFIEILSFVNMGNHLHLKVRFKNANYFRNFLRTFPALLARKITKAKRGFRFGPFWDSLVFTRVLLTSFEVLGLDGYFKDNRIQRDFGYLERQSFLRHFNLKLLKLKDRSFKT
jgi:REP element-mobilizing transposase RayT